MLVVFKDQEVANSQFERTRRNAPAGQYQDNQTRWLMVDELERDQRATRVYDSPLLTEEGREDYPSLLRDAVLNFDETWLADELLKGGRVVASEPLGQSDTETEVTPQMVRVLVAQEFNRLYCRAICRRAIESNTVSVEVYRAEVVPALSRQGEDFLHRNHHPTDMLDVLRKCESLEAALAFPSSQHSGLSLRLPR
jgi:hypothetical protein